MMDPYIAGLQFNSYHAIYRIKGGGGVLRWDPQGAIVNDRWAIPNFNLKNVVNDFHQ